MFKVLLSASALALALPTSIAVAAAPTPFMADANSPYAASTTGEFARDCDNHELDCTAMVGNVLMSRIQFSPTSHICLPGIDYASAVPKWLKAHPEYSNLKVEDGIYLALTMVYKCGPPNNY